MQNINYDLWDFLNIQQQFTSKDTSINSNQMPKTIKKIENLIKPGQKWADIGGGRFDNVINYFNEKQCQLFVYDPFNRSKEHNQITVEHIANSQCDGVMINNVLNVILEKENRMKVIKQAFDCLKENGQAFFKIYVGNSSGITQKSTNNIDSAQLNQPSYFYIDEIQEIFGNSLKVTKEFIVAQKSINLENNLINESKKYQIPQRYNKLGVGKFIGGNIYLHKFYSNLLPDNYKNALEILNKEYPNLDFQIIKYSIENQSYSFIQSPDFDTSPEPIVGNAYQVSKEGIITITKQKTNPQIYHHKWNFVKDDYPYFNVNESIQRSIQWKSIIGSNKEISSKIGTLNYWIELLNKHQIPLDNHHKKPKI